MSAFEKASRGESLRAPETEPASVTSRPSRTQVMPSATTTKVWNRPQRSRSRRAGISVVTRSGEDRIAMDAILPHPGKPPYQAVRPRTKRTDHCGVPELLGNG